jgi:glutaredoxin-like protein
MLLRDEEKNEIRNRLSVLEKPVRIDFFTQQLAGVCQMCFETEQLVKQVAGLSDRVKLEIRNFVTDKEAVATHGIDKIPAMAVSGEKDFGIRFYGIPSGYEFITFLEILIKVSSADSGLPPELKQKIQTVSIPVHIQVFVTPMCPYCTKAALAAVEFAIENEWIRTDIVEISEFPYLAQKYGVMGVPKIVINESFAFEGALPETLFVDHILNAVKAPQ